MLGDFIVGLSFRTMAYGVYYAVNVFACSSVFSYDDSFYSLMGARFGDLGSLLDKDAG